LFGLAENTVLGFDRFLLGFAEFCRLLLGLQWDVFS